jgi:hypothetical protein
MRLYTDGVKKIIVGMLLMLAMVIGVEAREITPSESITNFYIENGNGGVSVGVNKMVFLYNRSSYSTVNQDKLGIYLNLKRRICGRSDLKKPIDDGAEVYFIYIYRDGVLSYSITDCK